MCDVLANDASCSCEMTIYRQNSNDRSSGSSDAASTKNPLHGGSETRRDEENQRDRRRAIRKSSFFSYW